LARIGDSAQNKARDHGIRARIWKIDSLSYDISYLQLDPMPFGGEAERPVHVRVRLDSDDFRSRLHITEVGTGTRADLHDCSGQVGIHGLFVPSQMPIDVPVHNVEEGRVEAPSPWMCFKLRGVSFHGEILPGSFFRHPPDAELGCLTPTDES
jgi:hypothetical protein